MGDSVDSTGLAARNSVEQEENSTLAATESKPTEWTDEKHCLFLKSMESTFVNQLYKSIDLFGWRSHKNCPSRSKSFKHKPTSTRASSGQFKILHDGCWSKIDLRRAKPKVEQVEESKVLANPWIQYYRNLQIQSIRKFPASCATATENQYSMHKFQLWHQDSICNNTEVTDQNFNDDAFEEEQTGRVHNMKRMKTSTEIVSSNDQVVPFGNNVQVDDVAEDPARVPPKD